ncbi:ABC transporter substrate-binding protein [Roseibacterium sp. SDUM158017]|uniref:ABC transporter substrate-binding protein n=1 Tax=Roseicyclus salinarum TaxID=3036773 RepID=UPI002414FA18|nr:ABC transporter substrate-binding protein [Roseibacterium sp. SDUM158017]MDG4647886.1 ABC transporter substrate-binding protein [Roseibacterium sp. SDUM158017]
MSNSKITRRELMGSAAAAGGVAAFYGPWKHNRVHAQNAPIRIGITSDASGQYANSGASDRRGMLMAIHEANERGGVLGRQIEHMHLDTETTPATGSRVAERLINREDCGFLVGAVSSGVANAISQVAQRYGVIYLNTNSSSPTESGENCHRVKFVWDGNGANFSKAAVRNSIDAYGGRIMLLTNDYVWGHDTARATRALIDQYGGEVIDEILIPQGTRDFSAALLSIQQANPDVVAAAVGGDDQIALRQQVAQLGMGENTAWINNQQDWPDVYGLPLDNLFGVFGTTWYYNLDLPGVQEFVGRYQEMYPDTSMRVPGNVFYNGYMATKELLAAIERTESTNNHDIIRALEGHVMPAAERMQHHDAVIDPNTHQVQQTIYLATANPDPADENDMFRILTQSSPGEVRDENAPEMCNLESFEETPSFDA